MKRCTKCNIEKDKSEFNKDRKRKDGLQVQCKMCCRAMASDLYKRKPEAYKERARRQRVKRKGEVRELLTEIKTKRGCVFCSENTPCVLDFHHDDEKDRHISNSANNSHTQFNKEVKKCVVVCANCHRKIHAGLLIVEPHMRCDEVWETKKREYPITPTSVIGGKWPSRKLRKRT